MKTLLQLVQSACGEMGLYVPNSVAGNTAQDVAQMMYLANACGDELAREHDWEALNKECRFTVQYLTTTGTWTTAAATVTGIPSTTGLVKNTWMAIGQGIPQDTYISNVDSGTQVTLSQTPTAAQTSAAINFGQTKYAMPSDFDRQIDRTHFDKSKRWEMQGPETAQQWEFLKSSYVATGPRIRYRIMGGYFQIWPMTTTAEYLGFEYVSNAWATSSAGAGQTSFAADTDTCVYPDRLMVTMIKKKYFEVKGFDSTKLEMDYQRELSIAKANDAGSPILAMAPQPSSVLVGWENIPDSFQGF